MFYMTCPCGCKKPLVISDEDFNIIEHEDGTHTVGQLMESPCGYVFWLKRGVVKEFNNG